MPEVLGQLLGVFDRMVRRELRRQQQGADIPGAQRVGGQTGHHGRVDTARKADAGLLVTVLEEEVAESAAGRLIDHPRAVVVGRRNPDGRILGLGVENLEILLELLHHQHQLAAVVERARRAVVDDVRRASDLIDQHQILGFDERQMTHHIVTVGHGALAVFAGVDRDDGFDRLVEIVLAAQVVAHDDGALVTFDRRIFEPFRGDEKAHFAAGRDIFLAHVAQHLAVLNQRRGADGSLAREDRQSHDRGDAVAARSYFDQRVLAQFEEGRLTQQIESRCPAHGLFGKDDKVGALRFRFVDGIDDFRGVAVDIPDRVVQLGNSYLHLLVILVRKLRLCKVKEYL